MGDDPNLSPLQALQQHVVVLLGDRVIEQATDEKDKAHANADVKQQLDDLGKDQAIYVKLISSPPEQALPSLQR